MSLSGNLSEFSVLETLQLIGLQKKTGVLEVESTRQRRAFQFQDGRLLGCYADRPEDPDPVLEGLVALGVCEIRQARAWRSAGAHLDPDALRERCGLEAEEFSSIRRLLLQGAIDQVLLWDHGEFSFSPVLPATPATAPLNLEEILLESMRRLDEAVELRNGGLGPQAVPHAVGGSRSIELDDAEPAARWLTQAVLRRCDGRRSLKRIRADLGLAEYDILTAVSTLRLHGRVRIVTRGRGESAAEPLLEQPRRLPNPAAPLYAACLLALALGLGWIARGVTAGQTEAENRSALESRARFETERSLRHMLEIYRLREGHYPDRLGALAEEELWPRRRKAELAGIAYRAGAEGRNYELSFAASERIQSTASESPAKTAAR